MHKNNIIKRRISLFIILLVCIVYTSAQRFTIDAPASVVSGEKFRISYILQNAEADHIDGPSSFGGIKVLFGPGISQSSQTSIVNGKASSYSSTTYIYTARADKEGTYTIPAATITVKGKTISSNTKKITVLVQDKYGAGTQRQNELRNSPDQISDQNVFVRANVSKTKIYEQEAFFVTFKVYSTFQMQQVRNIEFPEFEGFITEDLYTPTTLQLNLESYKGHNYYVADLKRFLLFPQRSGKITIPSGKAEIVFYVNSGKQSNSGINPYNVYVKTAKSVTTNPLDINVSPLPEGKPADFANAIGSFNVNSSISGTNIKANDGVTLTVNITGNGNLKLIKTPEIAFPQEFEVYDPKITNDVEPTGGGLSGSKKIEYFFIPREEGKYDIPATTFSYFDPSNGQYKKLQIPAYTLNVAKDPTGGKNNSATSYNQAEKETIKDILYLKTGEYKFSKSNNFLFGSVSYILWYIIPTLLFIAGLIYYRKQLKDNQDIVRMKTKRANKIAIKRLKLANTYLQNNNNEKFYEEILRATWGYLSDKLSIPVANLNRENIELELNKYGASQDLIHAFIYILDTCEYARYAPEEPHQVMDNFYNKAVDAISDMESAIKFK